MASVVNTRKGDSMSGIVQCLTCSGRGWVHRLHPTVRRALHECRVVPLATARFQAFKCQCPKCHGYGKHVHEPKPRRPRPLY